MSERERHAQEVRRIAGEGGDARKAVEDYARKAAREVVSDSTLSAEEKKARLQELLLGIEEGLKEAGMEAKIILEETLDAFIFVFGDLFEQTEEALRSYFEDFRAFVRAAWEKGGQALSSLEKLMREHEEKKD